MPTGEQIERLKAVIGGGFQRPLTGVEHVGVVRLLFMLEHAMEWARELLTVNPCRDICMILSCVGGRVGWELHLLRLAVACLQGVMVFEHVAKVLDVLAVFRDREDVIGMRLQSSRRLDCSRAAARLAGAQGGALAPPDALFRAGGPRRAGAAVPRVRACLVSSTTTTPLSHWGSLR